MLVTYRRRRQNHAFKISALYNFLSIYSKYRKHNINIKNPMTGADKTDSHASKAIMLLWINKLTGQDLNRYTPQCMPDINEAMMAP
jgi:hypothetical protein